MARRRAHQPRQQEDEEGEEHVAEPEPESEHVPAPGMRRLEFDDEISWRPAKPIASATLVARLERLSKELADFDQGEVQLDSLEAVAAGLAHRNLLQHKDRGVKVYTACCLVDILRLFVPEAPYSDDQLKMMFSLFVKDILPTLHDPSNPYNSQHKYVLMSLTDVKSILLISEIRGADDLLLRLFNSAFDGLAASSKAPAEEQVAKDVEIILTEMLMELIDEAPGSIPAAVIDAIISQFLRAAPPGGRGKDHHDKQSTLLHKTEPAAYVMAKTICNGCADKMSRYVSQYFSDVILNASGFATKANGYRHGDDSDDDEANAGPSNANLKSLRQAHLLIRELWRAAPTILQNVVPQLDAELSADNLHLRLIATETFGDMISGIGAAGPPPSPVLDPTAYPPLRLMDEAASPEPVDASVLTTPRSPQSFAQTHPGTYRSFVGRKNDKAGTIRAAWVTAAGHILSTSAGGIGLSREDEKELVKALAEKLNDSEEKVRLAAVKAVELFSFRDVVLKLGVGGGVHQEGSVFASLADRCRDRKPAVRVDAMVLLGKLWAVGAGEMADGQEAVTACLSGVPSRIVNAFYANDPDLNILLDRVLLECLVPLKYPLIKSKGARNASQSSQSSQAKGGVGPADQDRIRAERILLMLKSLDTPAQKAFFAMQARQPQFAKAVAIFVQQCEAYNGGVMDANEDKVKAGLAKTFHWLGAFFPDPAKVKIDLQKFAKLNDRRGYQLVKYAIEPQSDFKTVRRAINELITKIQGGAASSCLDTLMPLLYRSSCLMFNRSHLATIMDYSKSDKDGLAAVAHQVLNDISQRNPEIFKTHAEELRKEIIEQAPTDRRTNDPAVVDILKAYSSYSKGYPGDVDYDRAFTQTLMNYALYGFPPKSAKHAVSILLAKNDDKSKVTATNLLRNAVKDLGYGSPHFLARLATISQLERLVPAVTADSDDAIHDLAINKILREVRTDAKDDSDPPWVHDADMDEELQAKCWSLKILVNQALASDEDPDAEERVKPVFKLLKTFVINEGEFCKTKDTPLHHKKRLRLLAGLLALKLCAVKKYDDQFEPTSFNKLAELVQDSELQVRWRFMEKLQTYLTRARLRARFHAILFLVAFEPVADLKSRVESWIRSRARYYSEEKQQILEATMGRLIPLLAHHSDYTADTDDLADFANYFLFYLGAVATEENMSLIYKYAERVKQTRDGVDPDASENLYVLSDLAQAVIRKFQDKRNWSFRPWPGKVGLPTGLYTALPSSELAQQIAKKQYIPDELDERLDDLIRAMDRKKKRKSTSEWTDQPAKRAKTQVKAAAKEKPEAKAKATKTAAKKAPKPKAAPRAKKRAASPTVPSTERRRSGRAHKVSDYKERDDAADEEMLEGVAEWDYLDDDDDAAAAEPLSDVDRDSGPSDEASAEEAPAEDDGSDEGGASDDERPAASKRNGRRAAAAKPKPKPAVKARVLALLDKKRPARARGRRGAKDSSTMEVDDDDE